MKLGFRESADSNRNGQCNAEGSFTRTPRGSAVLYFMVKGMTYIVDLQSVVQFP